jgi:hypothetical protein
MEMLDEMPIQQGRALTDAAYRIDMNDDGHRAASFCLLVLV